MAWIERTIHFPHSEDNDVYGANTIRYTTADEAKRYQIWTNTLTMLPEGEEREPLIQEVRNKTAGWEGTLEEQNESAFAVFGWRDTTEWERSIIEEEMAGEAPVIPISHFMKNKRS